MHPMTAGMLAAIAATSLAITVSTAYAQSCYDLWVQRNSVYKVAGYCFKTPRAIRYFGNAGCTYDNEADVPLSPNQRRQIASITEMEGRLGCSR
jgi:YARHG domain-containing protein